ncbi:hypothetical protein THUN1379_25030 [Paludibacterium sp. THUN1379]|uniref:porin n=1 Tax=Paludibacterium sp. THUN1379 TaxID=3112107 RepID=UPI0030874C8F|nr:hypothetical protein THUN1379_25030 [Paludibacterium sp. THUN1379]
MKLNKITLAVLATATLGASAVAMADDGVTVFGDMRVGVVNFNGNANKAWGYSAKENVSSTNIAGRGNLNFKGTENLGNGLSAIWLLSNRFSPTGNQVDDQSGSRPGTLASNDTYVGLKSNTLGTLVMGTNYGNFQDGLYDNTYVVGPDQIQGWFGKVGDKNMIRYDLPSFGNFNSSIQYATSENAGAATGTKAAQHATSLNVSYDNGFWGVSGAYNIANNQQTSSQMAWATNGTDVGTLAQSHLTAMIKPADALQLAVEWQHNNLNGNTVNSTALYAYYTLGAAQLGMQYGVQSYSGHTPTDLKKGKFIDAFVHYGLSKTTTAFIEVMNSRDGALSYANGQTSGSRVMTDIGLMKSF